MLWVTGLWNFAFETADLIECWPVELVRMAVELPAAVLPSWQGQLVEPVAVVAELQVAVWRVC